MCLSLENGLVVPVTEEDVHYTLGLPRGSVVITKRRKDDVSDTLKEWRSKFNKVKHDVTLAMIATKEDAAHGGRHSHGHTTVVKTAAEEFADKSVALGKALDDMVQFLESHPGHMTSSDMFRHVLSAARKIITLSDQCGRTAEDQHGGTEGGATQLEEDMWNNLDNLRAVDAIEKAAQQTNSAQQLPSFTVGLNGDIPTQRWGDVEAIVRQYDDVPMNDQLRGSRSQSPDAVSTGIPSFSLALTQEHPTTRWEEVCVTNHSSSPGLTEDHPTQLWAEAEAIARKYDVVSTLDTSRGSTSNPPPAGPIAVPVFPGPQ
nr:uncharacterized protein LOC109178682 isoform X2 [Ipomoea trifida]